MAKYKKLPSLSENPTDWYQEVVARAQLAEHAPVKGCMVMLPYGNAIWENIKGNLNSLIEDHGAENVCFPLLIPYSYLSREKEHVEGFSPEIAVVTHAGGEKLPEPLVVRPTSETIIHESMKRWITSYRDLPLKINQWANVMRWEKHPRLFLRTSEFFWQEGHTAHATEEEARAEVAEMTVIYHDFCEDYLAVPTLMGRKSEKEKFAGAVESYSIEGLMPDGRALQMGTIHYLGTNFSKMANVCFVGEDNAEHFVEMTSWGVSTRLIGAIIMVHGDDKGLKIPPRIAPTQVQIVAVSQDEKVIEYCKDLAAKLKKAGLRAKADLRDVRPGVKYNDSELRGIPMCVAIGAKEIAEDTVDLKLRDGVAKSCVLSELTDEVIRAELDEYHERLLSAAKEQLNRMVRKVTSQDALKQAIQDGDMAEMMWCNETECELQIKEATGASSRNMPLDDTAIDEHCKCAWCGKPARKFAYFAKAY
ncbi:MAG: proline--tRNA ligase [Candidatus Saccharibacteria bacterium]|nr:proline--tRNA ligase [Candidatus Saccharibacteria bacterium]